MVLVPGAGAERLRERRVVEHPADAGDMGEHAIEHARAAFVGVEALRDVVAQVAAGLRDAESQRVRHRPAEQIGAVAAQMADQVARRGKPDAQHARVGRVIVQFVDRARLRQRALRQPAAPCAHRRTRTPRRAVARSASAAPSAPRSCRRLRATAGTPAARRGACRRRIPRGCAARSVCRRRWRPARPATGPVAFGAPGSQPDHTSVNPSRSGSALPSSAAVGRCVARRAGAQVGEQHDPAAVVHFVQDAAVAAFRIGRMQDARSRCGTRPCRAHCAAPGPAARCRCCAGCAGSSSPDAVPFSRV